jgi:hypothetical protein
MTPARKDKLRTLARLMNQQNRSFIPITGPLLNCFDLVIQPDETDFLIHMGTEPFSYDKARTLCPKPDDGFREFIDTLLKKGLILPRCYGVEDNVYVLAPILVGWFELQLCGGRETPEKKEFARSRPCQCRMKRRFSTGQNALAADNAFSAVRRKSFGSNTRNASSNCL